MCVAARAVRAFHGQCVVVAALLVLVKNNTQLPCRPCLASLALNMSVIVALIRRKPYLDLIFDHWFDMHFHQSEEDP